jgi:hypothetical protein
VRELFANRISAFFGMDVLVSAVVLIVFMRIESRRRACTVPLASDSGAGSGGSFAGFTAVSLPAGTENRGERSLTADGSN